MMRRRAVLAGTVLFAGCASTPSFRDEEYFPVSQLRWNFERDVLPRSRQAGSGLGAGLARLVPDFPRVGALAGGTAGSDLGSLQEGIAMSLPDLSRTIARALGEASAGPKALAGTQRRPEGRAGSRASPQTLLGNSYTQSTAPAGASSNLADSFAGSGAAGAGGEVAARSAEASGKAVPLVLASQDRFVTDWREITGREVGVLWWRKLWLTEIRHEVRALPSSRDPTKLSNLSIESELRERPNADYPWQPAEVATPAARTAHAEIRARVLAAIRAAVDLKRTAPR